MLLVNWKDEAEITKTYWTVYIFTNIGQLDKYKSARETRSWKDEDQLLLGTIFIHKIKTVKFNSYKLVGGPDVVQYHQITV